MHDNVIEEVKLLCIKGKTRTNCKGINRTSEDRTKRRKRKKKEIVKRDDKNQGINWKKMRELHG
jgi:hypothetical protein